jgi:hypothetical protein
VPANDKENRAAENRARQRSIRGSTPGSIPWPEPRPLPWPGGSPGARWSAAWWRAKFGSPARIREWAAQELTAGRLLPWFAVAYGAGVVLYFTAEREPALWAAITVAALCGLGAVLLRRQIVPQVMALGVFGIALGFTVATLKTSLIGHPVLHFPASGVTVTGFVELREESQHTDRFVLCASIALMARASTTSRGACGFRSSAAWRQRRDLSSKSKHRLSRRCSRSSPAVTILRAICFSRASARPALSAAR